MESKVGYSKINKLMKCFLEFYCESDNIDYVLLSKIYEEGKRLNIKEGNKVYLNSAENIDFYKFSELINKIISNVEEPNKIRKGFHEYCKLIIIDSILDNYCIIHGIKDKRNLFSMKPLEIDLSRKPLIYLDYNVFIQCENDIDTRSKIIAMKECNQFCYSPAHIEEVRKRGNIKNHSSIIKIIEDISNSIGVFRIGDKLDLVSENPSYTYRRIVYCGNDINKNLEEYRVLLNKDKDIYTPEYKLEGFTRYINSKNILEDKEIRELFDMNLKRYGYSLERFETHGDLSKITESYNVLNSCIYAMMNSMMNLSYKADKKEKTIKSGIYDIEHLIYASKCNKLVSSDKKLVERAKIVFKLLKLDIEVLSKDEFIEKYKVI